MFPTFFRDVCGASQSGASQLRSWTCNLFDIELLHMLLNPIASDQTGPRSAKWKEQWRLSVTDRPEGL